MQGIKGFKEKTQRLLKPVNVRNQGHRTKKKRYISGKKFQKTCFLNR